VRSDEKHEDGRDPGDSEEHPEHRGGLLLGTELVETGADRGSQVRPELMLAFFRALIRNTFNGDAIALALLSAKSASGASDEEVRLLAEAIRNERPACNTLSGMFSSF